jgi:Protein of unknown function (Hypoth_ymh)
MDVDAALTYLLETSTLLDKNYKLWNSGGTVVQSGLAASDQALTMRILPLRKLATRIEPGLERSIASVRTGWRWLGTRNAVLLMTGMLEDQHRLNSILEGGGPRLVASRMHDWVWTSASKLWNDGHKRAAIQAAATQIDTQLQTRLGRFSVSGKALVEQAFSMDEPTPDKPRLRFPGLLKGSDSFKDAHQGAMSFGVGCMMAIRNPATHDLTEPDDQAALEQLAALSVLARWIDNCEVDST